MKNKSNLEPGGFMIINKSVGPTSHDVIDQLRRITGIRKIGHAGTLDPFAAGVLIVAISRQATKMINELVGLKKEYSAILYLGAESDTFDRTGIIKKNDLPKEINKERVREVLKKYTGRQKQVPPMYSAKKVKGKKLYELARRGVEIKREPEEIEIYSIELMSYDWPLLSINVWSSKGTYIRSLANDIGRDLGCGAYLDKLTRTAIGKFRIERSVKIKKLDKDNWRDFIMPIAPVI